MKTILFCCFMMLSVTAFSQQKNTIPPGNMPNVPLFKKNIPFPDGWYRRRDGDTTTPTIPKSGFKLPGQLAKAVPPGIYFLKGGMPCIVPDMRGQTPIPNAAPVVQLPFRTMIPNKAPHTFPNAAPDVR